MLNSIFGTKYCRAQEGGGNITQKKNEGPWRVKFCMVVQVNLAPLQKKSIAHPSRNSTGGCKSIAPLLS